MRAYACGGNPPNESPMVSTFLSMDIFSQSSFFHFFFSFSALKKTERRVGRRAGPREAVQAPTMSEQRFGCYHSSEPTHDTTSSRFLADSCLHPRLSAPFPPPAVLLRVPSDLSSTAPPPPAFRNTETSAASCRRGCGRRSGAALPGYCMGNEAGGAGSERRGAARRAGGGIRESHGRRRPGPRQRRTKRRCFIFNFIWKSHPETLVNNKYIDSYQEYIKNKDTGLSLRP